MADAVERMLAEDRVLLCEAGTGTGKTLAYLVPAILSGRKVVVSTATRALQEQIASHDLPLIQRVLGLDPRAAVMKGLSNYLCRRRFQEFRSSAESLRPTWARSLGAVESWAQQTETGDIVELASLAEGDAIWREVTSSSETRIGVRCPHYEECFATRMKRDAEAARLVIVNHHLFFADLALRGPHPARVIPDYDAVIFDEAHRLEDIATDFFGVRVSRSRFESLFRDAERALRASGLADPLFGGGEGLVESARAASIGFWKELAKAVNGPDGRTTLERDIWVGELEASWHTLDSTLDGLSQFARAKRGAVGEDGGPKALAIAEAVDLVERRTQSARDDLATAIEGSAGRVTWFDSSGRSPALSSSPVDMSHILKDRLFESVPAVALTSATLASTDADGTVGYKYLRSRVGLAGDDVLVDEAIVASPFEFEASALFYTPQDLPPPNDVAFLPRAVERIVELVNITDGGAFVLTTSLRSMRALGRGLRQRLAERSILIQGEGPKASLLGRFRGEGNSVLVATMSFWEGVDVPGRALRLVVLEKIPFAVPTDPVGKARAQAIEDSGGNAFLEFQVPAAAITLKQGFGRLIRTRADRGIVALLDERVHSRAYGEQLLQSLPPARRVDSIQEASRLWQQMQSPASGPANPC